MFELRRTYETQPGKERLVASILLKAGNLLVEAGLRDPFHVSFNGGTCPGERRLVHMTWTAEKIESTMRAGLQFPPGYAELRQQREQYTTDTWLELNELMTAEKMTEG